MSEQDWWCCKADYGEHEATCKNYNLTKENFISELKLLLDKYDAEIEAADDDKPYGMHSPLVRISLGNGKSHVTFSEFDLTWIDGERASDDV